MNLETTSWLEIESYLHVSDGVIIPTGSIEQHGPIGLIGTDTICAREIATLVGKNITVLIAPVLSYAPAEFNMAFPGTVSLSPKVFQDMCRDIFDSFIRHGFKHLYILNGHGANLTLLHNAAASFENVHIKIKSWWDFKEVNELRKLFYDDWEGMHATPSEIAITQVNNRILNSPLAELPPEKLSFDYIKAHSGDKHGPPEEHKHSFPDGRVGSHSVLAKRDHGVRLLSAAISAVEKDYLKFLKT